jgi:hypothetical protein
MKFVRNEFVSYAGYPNPDSKEKNIKREKEREREARMHCVLFRRLHEAKFRGQGGRGYTSATNINI